MKKIFSLVAAVLCIGLVLSFVGCGKQETTEKKTDKLVMATNAEFPPYEYMKGSEIVGIDVDIANALADAMGKELEIKNMDFDMVIPSVQNGQADVGIAGITKKPDRMESVDFSIEYNKTSVYMMVKEDSDITTPEQLTGKSAGVQQGTTSDTYVTDELKDVECKKFGSSGVAAQALSNGQVEAVFVDKETAQNIQSQVKGLKLIDQPLTDENYCIAIQKGNTELLNKVNEALQKLVDEGKIEEFKVNHKDAQ